MECTEVGDVAEGQMLEAACVMRGGGVGEKEGQDVRNPWNTSEDSLSDRPAEDSVPDDEAGEELIQAVKAALERCRRKAPEEGGSLSNLVEQAEGKRC